MRSKTKIFRYLTALPLLFVLQSFYWPANAASVPVRITVGHAGVTDRVVPLWVTEELGLFRKHGIEAQAVFFRGGPTLFASLVAGEISFAYAATAPPIFAAAAQGAKMKILASFDSGRMRGSVVASPKITKPEDLRGKRFGIQSIGGVIWLHTMLALEHLGLDHKRDNIILLVIGTGPQIAQALETGAIDAAVFAPSQTARLRSRGFSVMKELYPANIRGVQFGPVVSEVYLQRHPEVVEKLVTALIEGLAVTFSPKQKSAVLKTMMKHLRLADPMAAEEAYEELLLNFNRKPYPSADAFQNVRRLTALQNPRVASVKVEDLIEDRFVRKLDESGFIDRLYFTHGVK